MPPIHIAVLQSKHETKSCTESFGCSPHLLGDVQLPGNRHLGRAAAGEGWLSGCARRWLYMSVCAVLCVLVAA